MPAHYPSHTSDAHAFLAAASPQAFLKAALEYTITFDDLESLDPALHKAQSKLLEMSAEELAALYLTFTAEEEEAIVYETSKRRRPTELKPGGSEVDVTADNLGEYLLLFARFKLVGTIQAQVAAFREGLGCFVDAELRATLRACCTIAEIQLLLCGVADIDVDAWSASARYEPAAFAYSEQVRWLWAMVRDMSAEERSKLLFFCTGSARVPATGFATLMGYNGELYRFTVAHSHGADEGRLPTASSCFNKLYLPAYGSEAQLRMKLRLAIMGAEGFHEAAVAV